MLFGFSGIALGTSTLRCSSPERSPRPRRIILVSSSLRSHARPPAYFQGPSIYAQQDCQNVQPGYEIAGQGDHFASAYRCRLIWLAAHESYMHTASTHFAASCDDFEPTLVFCGESRRDFKISPPKAEVVPRKRVAI